MAMKATHSKPTAQKWQPAIEWDTYDRCLSYADADLAELYRLTRIYTSQPEKVDQELFSFTDTQSVGYRILKPIHDVWKLDQSPKVTLRNAYRILLKEMQERKSSYWSWSEKEWASILQPNINKFNASYHTIKDCRRLLLLVAYLLGEKSQLLLTRTYFVSMLARKVFGEALHPQIVPTISNTLVKWGFSSAAMQLKIPNIVYTLLLYNRSPYLEDLTTEVVYHVRQHTRQTLIKQYIYQVATVLAKLGYIQSDLEPFLNETRKRQYQDPLGDIPEEWLVWCRKWREKSTIAKSGKKSIFALLARIGRWLAHNHPAYTSPLVWNREIALEAVAEINQLKVGAWTGSALSRSLRNQGNSMSPAAKRHWYNALRTFFKDGQEWEWFPRNFDPYRCLATPASITASIGPSPRVISDVIWAKLMAAGLNLTPDDLALIQPAAKQRTVFYPFEMVKAITMVWLFAGLRRNEIYRLRLACISWQREDVPVPMTDEILPKNAVCMLSIPVTKTNTGQTKPVDPLVGKAIIAWEQIRPV